MYILFFGVVNEFKRKQKALCLSVCLTMMSIDRSMSNQYCSLIYNKKHAANQIYTKRVY